MYRISKALRLLLKLTSCLIELLFYKTYQSTSQSPRLRLVDYACPPHLRWVGYRLRTYEFNPQVRCTFVLFALGFLVFAAMMVYNIFTIVVMEIRQIVRNSNQLISLLHLHLFIFLVSKRGIVNKLGQASCLAVFDRGQLNKGSWLRGDPL